MEVIALDTRLITVEGKFVEIKVRSNEEDYKYYLFPTEVIEGTLNLLKENEIHVDDIPATSRILANLPLAESKYSVEELPESMCTALHSEVDINEIYELIDYASAHEDEIITVTL